MKFSDLLHNTGFVPASEEDDSDHELELSIGGQCSCARGSIIRVADFYVTRLKCILRKPDPHFMHQQKEETSSRRVDHALLMHEDAPYPEDQHNYHFGTTTEAICLLAQYPWIGSVRVFAPLGYTTVQIWRKPNKKMMIEQGGSNDKHHFLLVPDIATRIRACMAPASGPAGPSTKILMP